MLSPFVLSTAEPPDPQDEHLTDTARQSRPGSDIRRLHRTRAVKRRKPNECRIQVDDWPAGAVGVEERTLSLGLFLDGHGSETWNLQTKRRRSSRLHPSENIGRPAVGKTAVGLNPKTVHHHRKHRVLRNREDDVDDLPCVVELPEGVPRRVRQERVAVELVGRSQNRAVPHLPSGPRALCDTSEVDIPQPNPPSRLGLLSPHGVGAAQPGHSKGQEGLVDRRGPGTLPNIRGQRADAGCGRRVPGERSDEVRRRLGVHAESGDRILEVLRRLVGHPFEGLDRLDPRCGHAYLCPSGYRDHHERHQDKSHLTSHNDLEPVGRYPSRTLDPVARGASTWSGGGIIADHGSRFAQGALCLRMTIRRGQDRCLPSLQ